MKRIRRWYGNLNLRNKLRFSYILLILIPVTFLCGIYYGVASQSILDVAKENILDVTVKNTQMLDEQLSAIAVNAMHLNVDTEVFSALEGLSAVRMSEVLQRDKKLKNVLQKYFPESGVLSANIMTPEYVFGENSQLVISAKAFFDSELYRKIAGRRGEAQWIPTYQVQEKFALDFSVNENTVFTLAQELNPVWIDPELPNNVKYLEESETAVLLVNFSDELLKNIFSDTSGEEGAFYCISSRDGDIVFHTDASRSGSREELPWLEQMGNEKSGSLILPYQKRQMVVCYSVLSSTGWVAAKVTPVNSLLNNVSKIQLVTVLVWMLLFCAAMVLANVFSRRITLPVGRLVDAMRQAGDGDFTRRLPVSGTDEMQYLTGKYNEMGERIQNLIEVNYKSEIRRKESEIMALNLQLNPHFLYNTLNIINMMALEEGNLEVSKMLISLSDMLQYTFRNRQELTDFGEEYAWLQNYLHIMQARFEGKFIVRYEVSKELFACRVPRLLLQPLVENAIVHGFAAMDSGGVLTVRGFRENGFVHLEVEDNGIGMTQEALKKAMSGDRSRIGLGNAEKRLLLIFGERGRLTVKTKLGEGTLVSVIFPES